MQPQEKLFNGSFRGVPFLVKDTLSVEFGRKIALNEIPNSDRRTIQDLGLFNRVFELIVATAGISGTADYFAQRDALINAMEEPGSGILVHPTFGSIEVSPSTGTLNEDFRTFGEAEYSLTFNVSQRQIAPFDSGDDAPLINEDGLVANRALSGGLASIFEVSEAVFRNNVTEAIKLVDSFVTLGREAIDQIGVSPEILSEVNRILNFIESNAVSLVLDSIKLADSVLSFFDELLNLGLTPESNISLFTSFYTFCDEVVLSPSPALEVVQRNRNSLIFCQTIQAHALVQSYRSSGLIEFDNVASLNGVRDILDDQFDRVILETTLDFDSQDTIEQLRVATSKFFNTQAVAVFNLVDFDTPNLPITILTYNLYANTDNDTQLIALNDIKNVSFVSGEINILGA
jgi:prophage DNA circulation protein